MDGRTMKDRVFALNTVFQRVNETIERAKIKEEFLGKNIKKDVTSGISALKSVLCKLDVIKSEIVPAIGDAFSFLADFVTDPNALKEYSIIASPILRALCVGGYYFVGRLFPGHVNSDFYSRLGEKIKELGEPWMSLIPVLSNAFSGVLLEPQIMESSGKVPLWSSEVYAKYNQYLSQAVDRNSVNLISFVTEKGEKYRKFLEFSGFVSSYLGPSSPDVADLLGSLNFPLQLSQEQQDEITKKMGEYSQGKIIPKLKGVATLIEGAIKGIFRLMMGLECIILNKPLENSRDLTLGQYAHHLGLKTTEKLIRFRNSIEHMEFEIEESTTPTIIWEFHKEKIKYTMLDLFKIEKEVKQLAFLILSLNQWFLIDTLDQKQWIETVRSVILDLRDKFMQGFNLALGMGSSPKVDLSFFIELSDIIRQVSGDSFYFGEKH